MSDDREWYDSIPNPHAAFVMMPLMLHRQVMRRRKPSEWMVLSCIASWTIRGGSSSPQEIALSQIVEETGLGKRTIIDAIRALEDVNLIRTVRRMGSDGSPDTNIYSLNIAPEGGSVKSVLPHAKNEQRGSTESTPGGSAVSALGGSVKTAHTKESTGKTVTTGLVSEQREEPEDSRASLVTPTSSPTASQSPATPATRSPKAIAEQLRRAQTTSQPQYTSRPAQSRSRPAQSRSGALYGAGTTIGQRPLTGEAHKENKLARIIDLVREAGLPCSVDRQRDPRAVANSTATTDEIAATYVAIARGEFGDQWMQRNLTIKLATDRVGAYQISMSAAPSNGVRYRRGASDDTKRMAAHMDVEAKANYYGVPVDQYQRWIDDGVDPEQATGGQDR